MIICDINRVSGYNLYNPALAPQATMWGKPYLPISHNRDAVAHPDAQPPSCKKGDCLTQLD